MLRCELCNATFANDALMQQHLEGPAHRKALERKQAEAQRRQRLGRNYDAAEAAVVSSSWGAGVGDGWVPARACSCLQGRKGSKEWQSAYLGCLPGLHRALGLGLMLDRALTLEAVGIC